MGYMLRPGISCCSVAGRLLFLDIEGDRYFALAKPAEHAVQKIIAQAALDRSNERSLMALVDGGVLRVAARTRHEIATCAPLPPAETSLLDAPCAQGKPLGTLLACLAIAASIRRLKRRSLRENLAGAAARRRPGMYAHREGLASITQRYDRAGRLISAHDRCLPLSLAVMRAIAAQGHAAKLVLGVTLGPFAAHCWVQHGTAVVNDRVDRVRCYTPILVI